MSNKYDRINEMKKQQKMQKDVWKAKQSLYQQKKLLAPNLHDIFNVIENAHKCVYPKYKLEGILQFLDTKSIVMLSSTCKNFKKTIYNTNYINHPIHLNTRYEIQLNNEKKLKLLEKEKKANREYLAYINKKNIFRKYIDNLYILKDLIQKNLKMQKLIFLENGNKCIIKHYYFVCYVVQNMVNYGRSRKKLI
jgi:hypothetical protein